MKNKHPSIASFGSFIRKLRTDLNITQRDLAKKLGIAPSYLNDLEKEKRGAPKQATIKKLSTILKTSLNQLNDLVDLFELAREEGNQQIMATHKRPF